MTDMSLDEYIHKQGIKTPYRKINQPFVKKEKDETKFDRFKDSDDDDFDEMEIDPEMPRLQPIKTFSETKLEEMKRSSEEKINNGNKVKLSVHQRLGGNNDNGFGKMRREREKNRNNRFNQFQIVNKPSVQERLSQNFRNPAFVARDNIATNVMKYMCENDNWVGNFMNNMALFSNRAIQQPEKKYDMQIQREVHTLQGKSLFWSCPGSAVVSTDGPGLDAPLKVPQNSTDMSLNQRFA